MKRTSFMFGALALLLLLPLQAVAEEIEVDSFNCSYAYNYGEVEVGDVTTTTFSVSVTLGLLEIRNVYISGESEFQILSIIPEIPYPPWLSTGDAFEIEVGFSPQSTGQQTAVLVIDTDATNWDDCSPQNFLDPVEYTLMGTGIDEPPPTPQEMMEALIEYFDNSEENDICGVGPGQAGASHLRVFGRMLDAAADLIDAGDYAAACDELERAALKSDGVRPPDFIDCEGAITVNAMIGEVMDALGCE